MTPDLLTADLLELPVAYRDACAADLVLTLDLPRQEALAARTVSTSGWTVELRILGASHQVLVSHGDSAACSETVACRTGDHHPSDASLVRRHQLRGSVVDHHFTSRTIRLRPAAFRRRVEGLLAVLARSTLGLCGRFPGDPWATTGLRLESAGPRKLRWSGWHSYPETGEVVTTSSRLVLHGVAPGRDG